MLGALLSFLVCLFTLLTVNRIKKDYFKIPYIAVMFSIAYQLLDLTFNMLCQEAPASKRSVSGG